MEGESMIQERKPYTLTAKEESRVPTRTDSYWVTREITAESDHKNFRRYDIRSDRLYIGNYNYYNRRMTADEAHDLGKALMEISEMKADDIIRRELRNND